MLELCLCVRVSRSVQKNDFFGRRPGLLGGFFTRPPALCKAHLLARRPGLRRAWASFRRGVCGSSSSSSILVIPLQKVIISFEEIEPSLSARCDACRVCWRRAQGLPPSRITCFTSVVWLALLALAQAHLTSRHTSIPFAIKALLRCWGCLE
jgi:hypothetical protein